MRRLLVVLALFAVAGCGADDEPAAQGSLDGTPWVLTGGIDVAGWEQVAPTARFEDARLSGSSGCNRYGAEVTTDGAALKLGNIASTRMACPDGPGNQVEQAFLAALARVAAWRIDDGELSLLDGDDRALLRFRAASPLGSWTVTAFLQGDAVSTLIEGSTITAVFEDGGKLSGSAGCNRYSATFTLEPFAIQSPLATEMACATPSGVMEQEQAFLAALRQAASYTVEGGTLTLLTRAGTIAVTLAAA
jgi:heat shock protein HslJ